MTLRRARIAEKEEEAARRYIRTIRDGFCPYVAVALLIPENASTAAPCIMPTQLKGGRKEKEREREKTTYDRRRRLTAESKSSFLHHAWLDRPVWIGVTIYVLQIYLRELLELELFIVLTCRRKQCTTGNPAYMPRSE